MRSLSFLLLVVVALLCACGGGFTSAKSDYQKGRYADAKTKLEALEPDSRSFTGQRRAEYALYRGLTHLALGDRQTASVWLHEAKVIEDVHPHTLGGEDKARLDLALESLAAP